MRMRRIVICGLSGSTIFFPRYLINGTIFEKKLLNIKCVFIFSTILSEEFLILRRNERDMIRNVHWSSCTVPLFLSDFNEIRQIFEKYSNTKFHKSPSRGSRVVPCRRADVRAKRQTDTAKLTAAFSNLANSPKNGFIDYKRATAENVHIMYCFTTT